MMDDDLMAWLQVQLDDEERTARAARPGPWTAVPVVYGRPEDGWGEPVQYDVMSPSGAVVEHYMHEGGGAVRVDSEHIARWDPARVLALVTALRAILDSFSWEAQETRAILILAEALYGTRPGYREEWRP